jgi:hypothetical protein
LLVDVVGGDGRGEGETLVGEGERLPGEGLRLGVDGEGEYIPMLLSVTDAEGDTLLDRLGEGDIPIERSMAEADELLD